MLVFAPHSCCYRSRFLGLLGWFWSAKEKITLPRAPATVSAFDCVAAKNPQRAEHKGGGLGGHMVNIQVFCSARLSRGCVTQGT
jgi:hypothetical protein